MKVIFLLFVISVFTFAHILDTSLNNHGKEPGMIEKKISDEIVTVGTLKQILDAFNLHDLDAIMEFFSDDCSFDFPRGPEPWGQRFIGKAQVREALAGRFKGIPDVHYVW